MLFRLMQEIERILKLIFWSDVMAKKREKIVLDCFSSRLVHFKQKLIVYRPINGGV